MVDTSLSFKESLLKINFDLKRKTEILKPARKTVQFDRVVTHRVVIVDYQPITLQSILGRQILKRLTLMKPNPTCQMAKAVSY